MAKDLRDLEADIMDFRRATHGNFVSRRAFTAGLAALGLSPLTATLTPVNAKEPDLVVANWGGDAARSMDEAYTKIFVAANPQESGVKYDSSGPSSGKIKAMVDAKRVTWDMCDRIFYNSIELGEQGLLTDINYDIVKKDMTLPGMTGKWAVPFYSFGNVLTYQTKIFDGRIPSTWADFWNLKDFPGRRTMRRHIEATLEAALMADGVPADKLYPIDVKRAFEKVRQIKQHVTFWSSHTDSYRLLREKEVAMGILAHTRSYLLRNDTKGDVDFTFNQGIFWTSGWIVPKGNPGAARVWKLINATLEPEAQLTLLRLLGNGPVNPEAIAKMPPELAAVSPSSPENLKKMVIPDSEWYAKNSAQVLNQFLDQVLS
jgi:putative spermidine/putrescine transport system substrate-binding protein